MLTTSPKTASQNACEPCGRWAGAAIVPPYKSIRLLTRVSAAALLLLIWLSVSTIFAQEPPTGPSSTGGPGSIMEALANPAGAGSMGPRRFASTTFDAGQIAFAMLTILGVLAMGPGGLLFYAAWIRKPVAAIVAECIVMLSMLSLVWLLLFYTFAFSHNLGTELLPVAQATEKAGTPVLGNWEYMAFGHMGSQVAANEHEFAKRRYSDVVPHVSFLAFQLAVYVTGIIPLLIVVRDRLKPAWGVGILLAWSLLVYVPAANWVWGFGWLVQRGVLDYAGGCLVHLTVGISALLIGLWTAPRNTETRSEPRPLSFTPMLVGWSLFVLGQLVLQSGARLNATAGSATALLNGLIAATAGVTAWAARDWLRTGRIVAESALLGAWAGLVGSSVSGAFVAPQSALIVGILSSLAAQAFFGGDWQSTSRLPRQVFALHAIPAIIGSILAGAFISPSVSFDLRGEPVSGLLTGNVAPMLTQGLAILSCGGLAAIVTAVLMFVVRLAGGFRVPGADNVAG